MSYLANVNVEVRSEPVWTKEIVCVTTFVFGAYYSYIPAYVYSVLKAYPKYYCKIFVDGEPPAPVLEALKLIKENLSDRFEIKDIFSVSGGEVAAILKAPCCAPALRWFLPPSEFSDFDYVYYGDIDFLIVPEAPSLGEQHIQDMDFTGLPFSNAVRSTPRLTGLHFIKSREYFDAASELISDGAKFLRECLQELPRDGRDERVLYSLLRHCGFSLSNDLVGYFRPYHGYHYAAARKSLLRLLFFDIRHDKRIMAQQKYGWNAYPRGMLFTALRKFLFQDPVFTKIIGMNMTPAMRRTCLILDRSPWRCLKSGAALVVNAPHEVVRVGASKWLALKNS